MTSGYFGSLANGWKSPFSRRQRCGERPPAPTSEPSRNRATSTSSTSEWWIKTATTLWVCLWSARGRAMYKLCIIGGPIRSRNWTWFGLRVVGRHWLRFRRLLINTLVRGDTTTMDIAASASVRVDHDKHWGLLAIKGNK